MNARSTPACGLLAALACGACAGTEVGNPVADMQVSLTARSTDDGVVLGADADASVAVEEAWVVLADLRFVMSDRCESGDGSRIDVEGPIVHDLAQSPVVLPIRLPGADYCRVRVPLETTGEAVGGPGELVDHALLVRGTRADGTHFMLRSRRDEELEVRARGTPFRLDDAMRATILAFDVGVWLAGVDLDAATLEGDGSIVIEDGSNDALLDAFEENVRTSLSLFRDLDEDGGLDPEDLAELLAAPQ